MPAKCWHHLWTHPRAAVPQEPLRATESQSKRLRVRVAVRGRWAKREHELVGRNGIPEEGRWGREVGVAGRVGFKGITTSASTGWTGWVGQRWQKFEEWWWWQHRQTQGNPGAGAVSTEETALVFDRLRRERDQAHQQKGSTVREAAGNAAQAAYRGLGHRVFHLSEGNTVQWLRAFAPESDPESDSQLHRHWLCQLG